MHPMVSKTGRALLSLLDGLWALGGFTLCLAWWTGWILKDRHPALFALFYFPAPVLIVAGFLWLFHTVCHRFRLLQLFVFITVLAAFFNVLVVDHRWRRAPEKLPENTLRILHWKTAPGLLGVEAIVRSLVDEAPDIIVLAEPEQAGQPPDIAYHALGMVYVFADGGITVASHFPITHLGSHPLPSGNVLHLRVATDLGPVEIAAVDFNMRPGGFHRDALRALTAWTRTVITPDPLVLTGDFRTPRNSAWLAPLRLRFRNAYEEGGRGWPGSWPSPVPLYTFDQTWVSRGIIIQDYQLKTARFGSHQKQIIDLTLPPPAPPGDTLP